MAKTNEKPAISLAQELADRQRQLLQATEEALMRICRQTDLSGTSHYERTRRIRSELSQDELLIVSAMGWDDQRLGREISRVITVVAHLASAGTSEERNKARQDHKAALAKLREARPRLEQVVRDAENELRDLEREANRAETLVTKQEQAVLALREKAPEHIRQQCRGKHETFNQCHGKRLGEIESRIRFIEGIAVADAESRSRYAEFHKPDLLVSGSVDETRWSKHMAELQAELPTLKAEQAELESKRAAMREEVAKLEDYYLS